MTAAQASRRINQTEISLLRGDITQEAVDVIVNAANSSLLGGGGVDGAIHRAGGPEILEECKLVRKTHGQCAPGDAVITQAGKLKAKYVVHTVGPIWRGGNSKESETLASAYRTSLELAEQACAVSIAFPSISTGAYGYPVDQAAPVALEAVKQFCLGDTCISEISFVLFDERTLAAYKQALDAID